MSCDFEHRHFDVPAAKLSKLFSSIEDTGTPGKLGDQIPTPVSFSAYFPIVVPFDKPYTSSGDTVVSNQTARHVGYNGFRFRGLNAFPELSNTPSQMLVV